MDKISTIQKAAQHLQKNNLELAESLIRFSILYEGNSWEAHINLGIIYIRQNKFKDGVEQYKKALNINPKEASIYYNLSLAYEKLNEINSSLENAQTAVNLDSHNACYIEHLGKIYAINRQYDIALKYIQTALEIEPSNTSMLITYAGILIENDMFIEAEKALIDASRKTNNPEHKSNILNNLLILQFQYGNYDKAKDTIDMMERVSYKNKKLMTFKSMLSLIKKDFKNGWIYHENRDVRRPAWCIEKQEYNNEPNARVFVSAEQGIGDEIMFSSVLPDLIKRNKSVILEFDERLSDIYKRSFGEKVRVINATQILHIMNMIMQ